MIYFRYLHVFICDPWEPPLPNGTGASTQNANHVDHCVFVELSRAPRFDHNHFVTAYECHLHARAFILSRI